MRQLQQQDGAARNLPVLSSLLAGLSLERSTTTTQAGHVVKYTPQQASARYMYYIVCACAREELGDVNTSGICDITRYPNGGIGRTMHGATLPLLAGANTCQTAVELQWLLMACGAEVASGCGCAAGCLVRVHTHACSLSERISGLWMLPPRACPVLLYRT